MEIITNTIQEFRYNSYVKNEYSHWIAAMTSQKNIVFFRAYTQKQMELNGGMISEYLEVNDFLQFINGKELAVVLEKTDKKFLFSNADNTSFLFNRVIINNGMDKIKLKSDYKNIRIIKNILKNKMSYEDALKNSGFNFSRLILWFLMSFIITLVLVFAYFSLK